MIFYCEKLDETLLFLGVTNDGERTQYRYCGNGPPPMSEDEFTEYLFATHEWVLVGYL